MMYKVGDEVLVKGEVVEVMSAVPYPTKVRLGKGGDAYVFSNDELCFADEIVKTYELGLNDAWNFAKNLIKTDHRQRNEIFGLDNSCNGIRDVYERFTPQEALAKIEAYEKEKAEIKVGDVVTRNANGFNGIVTSIKNGDANVMYDDGSTTVWSAKNLTKTGKHIDIEGLLRQIGE